MTKVAKFQDFVNSCIFFVIFVSQLLYVFIKRDLVLYLDWLDYSVCNAILQYGSLRCVLLGRQWHSSV